jgi:small subunit ribosomal protein S9
MNNENITYSGIGKRKTSIAKVYLQEGSGTIFVNKKSFESFFTNTQNQIDFIKYPLILANLTSTYNIDIKVKGGGIISQLNAVKLAISKAVSSISPEYRSILNKELLLTRDSRIKERRKYGLKKARKAPQYSKR